MRSRSPNRITFSPSNWCICASLVKFKPLVQEIVCTQAFFYQNLSFKVPVWPWKWDQGHQNLITSFPHHNDVSVLVWSNSIYWFMRQTDGRTTWKQYTPPQTQPLWPPSWKDKRPQFHLYKSMAMYFWTNYSDFIGKIMEEIVVMPSNSIKDRPTCHRSLFQAYKFAMHFRTSWCDGTDYASV